VCNGAFRDFNTALTSSYLLLVAAGRIRAEKKQDHTSKIALALHSSTSPILDSGAGIHVVQNEKLISNHRPSPFNDIEGFDGSKTPVRAFGDIGQLTGVVSTDTKRDLISTGLLLDGTNYAIVHDAEFAYMVRGIKITRQHGRPPDIDITGEPKIVEIASRDPQSGLYLMHPLLSTAQTPQSPGSTDIFQYLQHTRSKATGKELSNIRDKDWISTVYTSAGTSNRTPIPVNTNRHNAYCRHCTTVSNTEADDNDSESSWACANNILEHKPLRKSPRPSTCKWKCNF